MLSFKQLQPEIQIQELINHYASGIAINITENKKCLQKIK